MKQTKQTVLDEARLRANGKSACVFVCFLYFFAWFWHDFIFWVIPVDSSVDPDSEDEQCNQAEEPTNKDGKSIGVFV